MGRRVILGLTLLLGCSSTGEVPPVVALTEEVDVFIGTGGTGFGVGSMIPGPHHPFGLAKPSPDTSTRGGAPGFSHCAGYWYEDTEVQTFSQLHLVGTGVPDLGVIGLMPATALPEGDLRPADYRADLEHRLEEAEVGAYRVKLLPAGIDVRVGATPRTSIYSIQYPAGQPAHLVLDLAHGLGGGTTVDSGLHFVGDEVRGWLLHRGDMSGRYGGFQAYFVLRFAQAPVSKTLLEAGQRRPELSTLEGSAVGAVFDFGDAGAKVELQLGLSFLDEAGAQANLEAEWANFDLAAVQARTRDAWEALLQRVIVEGGEPVERAKFYTALYHLYAMPTDLTEAGRRYRGIDGVVTTADGFTYYSDFSLWDTFRTFHPLMALLSPSVQRDFNRSLERMAEVSGRIPKWPLAVGETNTMIGYHAETVLADSYQRGVTGFDVEAAYRRFRRAALPAAERDQESLRERDCGERYFGLGYCAVGEDSSSVSKTLENAFADHVLGTLAQSLGEAADGDRFLARAQAYRQVIDPALGMAQGKRADGTFQPVAPDLFAEEFIEGNAWQWTSFVPHDVPGWAEALGGHERAVDYLDQFFQGTADTEDSPLPDLYYWHGNEPDIHAAYLYAELGERDRLAKWVDWIRRTRYNDGPSGLDGNDDGGTLSAWLILADLGLFPKLGEGRWILGTPAFPKVSIALENGAQLVIEAENWRAGATQVDAVKFDDVAVEGPFIDHAKLAAGGTLTFVMRP